MRKIEQEQPGTKGPAIERNDRDEMKPSIDAAAKMADVLGVSLDWLAGHTDYSWFVK